MQQKGMEQVEPEASLWWRSPEERGGGGSCPDAGAGLDCSGSPVVGGV